METKVTEDSLQAKIANVEQLKFVTNSGQILRWAVITMANGFAVTGDPSCAVDPANDDEELGQKIALQNAVNKVWVLEGYALKEKLFQAKMGEVKSASKDGKVAALRDMNINPVPTNVIPKSEYVDMSFGEAIIAMKKGNKLARAGWNGKNIHIAIQKPYIGDFITHPYIYIDSTQLQTDNPDAVLNRVPWLASQTDMLAVDWRIA